MGGKRSHQRVTLHIVGPKHMPHAPLATVRRAVTVHMTYAGIMPAVTGLKIQRTKFVDTKAASVFRTLAVQSAKPPVFGPELRVLRVLPRLGMTPVNFAPPQHLTPPFQGYRRKNLLLQQVRSQLLQRPNTHPDQLLRRRKGHFANLFHHIRKEFSRSRWGTVIRIPRDRLDTAAVEPMEDLAYPCRGTAAVFRDRMVRTSTARQQNNSRMTAVDGISQLSFHTFELLSLPGPKLPCHNSVHSAFSTFGRLLHAAKVENLY